MTRVNVSIDPAVFNEVYLRELMFEQARWQVVFGGSSSGKSKSLAQRAVVDLLSGGRNYLCARKTSNSIRTSTFNEVKKIISEWNLSQLFTITESDMDIVCKNGYMAMFKGLDDVEKLKSITPQKGILTDIWVEEATEASEEDIKQLEKRLRGETEENKPKRITLSFNPILRTHWIFKRFFGGWTDHTTVRRDNGTFILKTTYLDNRFLAPDDIKAMENETDEYMRAVYVLGNWGVLGDVIFKNLVVADLKADPIFKTFDIFRNGLDFGFSHDPTAYNRMYYHRASRSLYIVEELNSLGWTNDIIAKAVNSLMPQGEQVVCDSAEPKSIAELNMHGCSARGAQKGKDSVGHGIQWLKQQTIYIDSALQSTINDFQGYHWKKDRNGERLPIPSDQFSHHPDAVRYGCEDLVFEAPAESVSTMPSLVHAVQTEYDAYGASMR
jgi:phage terminase large subunit